MSNEDLKINKTERLHRFLKASLEEDIIDLRGIPVKESSINLGLSVLMLLVTVLHLVLSVWQFVVSLLLVGYDGLTIVLVKIMPAPKQPKETAKEQP